MTLIRSIFAFLLIATNGQNRIRLSGIDAPELHQAFGQRAKQAL